jgi:4-hydroxy-3-polyprenylbenzoate decarboxylase
MDTTKNIVVAVTGASGAVYAHRLLEVLLAAGCNVHLTMSSAAQTVLRQELDLSVDLDDFQIKSLKLDPGEPGRPRPCEPGALHYHNYRNLLAPIASGSFLTDGMVICPCSMGSLSAVVHGTSTNLIHRAAEVHMKERRKLILVPREAPLSVVALDNLRRAAETGAVILPAMPGFYHGAKTVRDLVDFVVARICDQLGVENTLIKRWGSA